MPDPTPNKLTTDEFRALRVVSRQIQELEAELDVAREQRRALIVHHVLGKVSRDHIAEACEISRQRLSKIMDRNGAPKHRRSVA